MEYQKIRCHNMKKNMTCYHELGKLSPEYIKDLTDKCHNQEEWYRAHDTGLRPGDTAYRKGKNYKNNVEADYVYYYDDFIFSYATLENIVEVEKAMSEFDCLLKRGGYLYLAPAWNCRVYRVKKLDRIPYSYLSYRR